ncbi:F-box/LRR-repeat protein 8 isoform X2 [Scyliorhinus canicula]|uniref:F-box/LRR-repeat protein 8 isoform X2 n=1 Tax=Scyliorhinus canicula TaxID=7830 RepID=UPI0018F2C79A|nr:F-box/LRR-repeat protein 8 isoform X2 [Scyliorhinus canicula]
MSRKHSASDGNESSAAAAKKTRKTITLEIKLEVLKRFEAGERAVAIGRALGLPPTTVRTIRGNTAKIKQSAQSVAPFSAGRISRTRSSIMENMERLLEVWIKDQNQRNVPLSLVVIQTKAKSFFNDLQNEQGGSSQLESFSASRGWFERFKKRSCLHNIKVTSEAAIAAVDEFPSQLKRIIEEGGYSPKHVFNFEAGLSWKRMPQRTYISKEEKTECASNHRGSFDIVPEVQHEMITLAREVGFDEVEEADMVESLVSHGEKSASNDLMQLESQPAEEEVGAVTSPPRVLSTKRLSRAFQLIEEAMEIFAESDPNKERSAKVNRAINDGISCYKEIYRQKKKETVQQSLDKFFKDIDDPDP